MKEKVKNLKSELLSRTWSILEKYTYDYLLPDGRWEEHVRECYNRGDGVTVILFNPEKCSVILTRQFRLPTYLNGNTDGMLIETCAGKLEKNEDPLLGIKREIEEETGHRVTNISKIMEAYMSPGSVTELIHFYLAEYSDQTRISSGGGLHHEQENIEVLEMPLKNALQMIETGEIRDGKSIMLLQYVALRARMN